MLQTPFPSSGVPSTVFASPSVLHTHTRLAQMFHLQFLGAVESIDSPCGGDLVSAPATISHASTWAAIISAKDETKEVIASDPRVAVTGAGSDFAAIFAANMEHGEMYISERCFAPFPELRGDGAREVNDPSVA